VNSALAISNAAIKNLAFFVMIGCGHWNRKPQRPPLPTWPSAANLPILRKEKEMQVEIEYCGM
jgi:hypothetical protein